MADEKTWWVVSAPGGELAITDSLKKAEDELRRLWRDEEAEDVDETGLIFDIKFGDWYLIRYGRCLWEYSAKKADML
jgi:hypothetical protein